MRGRRVRRRPEKGAGRGKRESADLLRRADAVLTDDRRATLDPGPGSSWCGPTGQACAVLLPVKGVGVMGDGRIDGHGVALRALQAGDFMTADRAELPDALLEKASSRSIDELRGVRRVSSDVNRRPSTIDRQQGSARTGALDGHRSPCSVCGDFLTGRRSG